MVAMFTTATATATGTGIGMGLAPSRASRQNQNIAAPKMAKRIISLAIILTLSVSSHAFTLPLRLVHPSGPKSFQLFALQPSKGGIIVQAKSDYVARDILIDSFMGRDSSSSSGEKELGWKEPQQDLDMNDNFAPNESAWLQSSNISRRTGQQQQQQQQGGMQPQQHSQFQSASVPVPPALPPQPIITQAQQQEQQQQRFPTQQQQPLSPSSTMKQSTFSGTSGTSATKSKLPDPSLMKLSDIQGELSLRRIAYNDCFDRTSLEAKLREARLVMMKTTTSTTRTSSTPWTTAPRASPAEQAIFSSSFASSTTSTRSAALTSATTPLSSSASSSRVASSSSSSPSLSSSSGNPFRRQTSSAKNNSNNNRGGQNSSSSFRDNSHGIGFGDANSYYSSVGPRGGGGSSSSSGSGGGDGVRLGKQRTSYGEFGGGSSIIGGTSIGGVGKGRTIDNSISNFGSENKSTSFYAGGMSIKGDSSIFSSAGFVGQQGTVINTFSDTSSGGRSTSTSGSFAGVTNTARSAGSGELPMRTPVPPMEEPQLDWLMQDPPENKHDFLIGSVWDSDVTNYDASSRFDENVFNDNAVPTSYNSKWISQQYQEQGLDFLSGGQVGFGAIKGIETSGGESRNRGQVNNVTTPGSGGGAGNTGVTMGGDFVSYGNSNVGDGQRRSSARYSGGGGGAFGGMDYID